MKSSSHLPGIFDVTPIITKNQLFYGDNLTIMRTMPNACVDLIYLDPPWNSKKNYNLIYKKLTGQPVPEQEEAFCDTWEMDPEKEDMARKMPIVLRDYGVDEDLVMFWKAWIDALRHTQPRLLAYLVYMTYRLFEMRRILKPTGSIYLHCDPTASHYIKVIMDGVFGHNNFQNEISWRRSQTRSSISKMFKRSHDVIFFYTKSPKHRFNIQYKHLSDASLKLYVRHDSAGMHRLVPLIVSGKRNGETGQSWKGIDPNLCGKGGGHWLTVPSNLDKYEKKGLVVWPTKKGGLPQLKYYLADNKGVPITDFWDDIDLITSSSQEALGYPTQKPIALLNRIISASSNPGDVVFDPFCGCGTAVYAAHLLGRKWIGCDIAILSVRLVRDVLLKRYGLTENKDYDISGVPLSVEGAEELFSKDPRQFQHWAVELAGGFSSTKYSGDKGIDGRIHFETKDGLKNMILSVKGGKLSPAYMRELHGTLERESNTEMAGLICLQQSTKGMREEAASAGVFRLLSKDYDKLQVRTIQDLLDGKGFDTPSKVQTLGWKNQIVMPI